MTILRPYQIDLASIGVDVLRDLGIVYLAMEVRTGKTLTALEIARLYGAKNVLFLTKKKAIASIESDYCKLSPGYLLTILNDESMHRLDDSYDLIIHDEHHRFGAFPKPGAHTRLFRESFGHLPMIFLSGTPTPESYSQIYHQFWVSERSPFTQKSFYAWAREFVSVTQKRLPHGTINDYSDARIEAIAPIIDPYMVRYTQSDAGFASQINEQICWVDAPQKVYSLAKQLVRDRFIQGRSDAITCNNAAALQQKLHQLYSGTMLFDERPDGARVAKTLSDHKVDYLKAKFGDRKIVIFYKFVQEGQAILDGMGDRVTTDLEEFQCGDKSIALQIVSGREGLNLSAAEVIVFFNIDFSATSYWQARDRLTTMTRQSSEVYWLFTVNGIEEKIYNAVQGKKNYTVSMFQKDFGIERVTNPVQINQAV